MFGTYASYVYKQVKKVLIYDIFKKEINFSSFPLCFKRGKNQVLMINLFFTLIMLGYYIWTSYETLTWSVLTGGDLALYFSISSIFLVIHFVLVIGCILWTNKIVWTKHTLYSKHDTRVINWASQENFSFDISQNQFSEIDTTGQGWKINLFKNIFQPQINSCNKKIQKLTNTTPPNKEIKLLHKYLRIYGLFIWRMEREFSITVLINQVPADINELKKVAIQNFFYFKNLNQTKE
ncbi:hypothetical protein [Williamsoniiplasma lucivorax]|nr:hypothetical protein [Williamsoniiplasma lucivorax]